MHHASLDEAVLHDQDTYQKRRCKLPAKDERSSASFLIELKSRESLFGWKLNTGFFAGGGSSFFLKILHACMSIRWEIFRVINTYFVNPIQTSFFLFKKLPPTNSSHRVHMNFLRLFENPAKSCSRKILNL